MPTFFVKNGIYIYIRLKNMKIKKQLLQKSDMRSIDGVLDGVMLITQPFADLNVNTKIL